MQQDPAAGRQARRQRTIRVWVSAGPRATTVPALVGQTERTARMRLEQDGLEVGIGLGVPLARLPGRRRRRAGSAAVGRARRRCRCSLNRGEQATTYVMPDLIGINGERAAEALRTRGFRVTIVGSQPYPGVPPGTVVRQQPAGGFQVGPADAISLEVSR